MNIEDSEQEPVDPEENAKAKAQIESRLSTLLELKTRKRDLVIDHINRQLFNLHLQQESLKNRLKMKEKMQKKQLKFLERKKEEKEARESEDSSNMSCLADSPSPEPGTSNQEHDDLVKFEISNVTKRGLCEDSTPRAAKVQKTETITSSEGDSGTDVQHDNNEITVSDDEVVCVGIGDDEVLCLDDEDVLVLGETPTNSNHDSNQNVSKFTFSDFILTFDFVQFSLNYG